MAATLGGQVAIVTGGGRGIGRTIAQALATAGAAVAVVSRSVDQVAETVALIEAAGARAIALACDVTDQAAVERIVAETERQLGPVDLLVNNAGVVGPIGPVWELEPPAWRRTSDVDVYGPFLCCRAVLPGMVARRRGRIINMSTSISLSAPYYSAYMAAKVGLTRLSECLALEVREYSISVFSIAPGAVRTAMAEEVIASPWDRTMEEAIGIDSEQRWLTPVELSGQLCVTLASGEADALSGRHIDVRQDIAALVQQAEQIVDEDRYALRVRM